MAIPYLVDIDLTQNQLRRARIENLAVVPMTPVAGQIYFDTVLLKLRVFTGTIWVSFDDANDPRPALMHVLATQTALGPEHSISGAAAGHVLRASGATTANFQQLAHGDLSGIGSNTHAQIDTHMGNATIHRELNDALTSTTNLWSAQKISDLIQALNSAVAGALVFKGGYNASTNVPNLSTPTAGTVLQGYTYVVTAGGTFLTEAIQVGDMLIAQQDNPTARANWTIVNKNIPDIVSASETAQGIVELATNAEAQTGTDNVRAVHPQGLKYTLDNRNASETQTGLIELATVAEAIAGADAVRAITPKTLNSVLGTGGTLSLARKYTQVLTTSATSYTISHGLATTALVVSIRDTVTPFSEVEVDIAIPNANSITIGFNVAPVANKYAVTIIG